MIPTETLDPRGPWSTARRMEVFRYAKEKGVSEIKEQMPKDVMVRILQAKGIAPPNVRPRLIGKNFDPRSWDTDINSHHYNGNEQPSKPAETVTIDADELLEREWKSQEVKGYNEMRAELKAAGVKLSRRWNKDDVRAEWEKLKRG